MSTLDALSSPAPFEAKNESSGDLAARLELALFFHVLPLLRLLARAVRAKNGTRVPSAR